MKDHLMKLSYSLFLAVLIALTSSSALAQGGQGGPPDEPGDPKPMMGPGGDERTGGQGGHHEERIDQRLNAIRMYKLVELLNLDEEKAAKLAIMMRQHREKITPLQTKFKDLADKLRAETNKEKPDAKELDKLISSYKETAKTIQKEREDNTEKVLGILTPAQKGKYLLFHENFPREFKEKMKDFMMRNIEKFKGKMKRRGPDHKEDPKIDDAKNS